MPVGSWQECRRGSGRGSSGGARQWLTDRAAFLEPAEASRLTVAAESINRPENATLRAVFVAGQLSVSMLVTVLAEVPKAMVALPDARREQVLGYYLQLTRAGSTRADLRGLTKRIIAEFGDEQLPDAEERAQRAESLSWRELPSGLREMIAVLSPAHAAQMFEAITALSAPRPGKDPRTGAALRDERTPGKRRADALMELLGAAARCADPEAMRSTAKVIVTMGLDNLLRRLGRQGFGVTATGQVLDAATARQLACAADIIPVVLGGNGQPLDVGREVRLFTGAVRTAIIVRDKHCTFPGCDRPPGWCEAHHIIPWWAGGPTAVGNGTLLCTRHHGVVHAKGYLAVVTADGVAWDLTPGRMSNLAPADRPAA
ncbi:HNH endonuclease signature motif containing protein [Flexivirga lutea]